MPRADTAEERQPAAQAQKKYGCGRRQRRKWQRCSLSGEGVWVTPTYPTSSTRAPPQRRTLRRPPGSSARAGSRPRHSADVARPPHDHEQLASPTPTDSIADMSTSVFGNANTALHDVLSSCPAVRRRSLLRTCSRSRLHHRLRAAPGLVGTDPAVKAQVQPRPPSRHQRHPARAKPGRRAYVHRTSIPRVLGGMGIAVLSTSQGVITGHEARRRAIGGALICRCR